MLRVTVEAETDCPRRLASPALEETAMIRMLALAAVIAAISVGSLTAAKKGDDGAPAFRDDFSAAKLGTQWTAPKGEWMVHDGALAGRELAADNHAAVLNLGIPNKDSRIHFRFQLDGAKGFNFSMNHAKGHLFRVNFKPDGLTVTTDKVKDDPASKVETIAEATAKFETGHWYAVDVEMVGDHVSVKTDNGIAVEGSHRLLDTQKPNYRFVIRDGDLKLDDVAVWMK
jgi:hypothetical protein